MRLEDNEKTNEPDEKITEERAIEPDQYNKIVKIDTVNDGLNINTKDAGAVNVNIDNAIFQSTPRQSNARKWASLDSQKFCLFVLENEIYDKEFFCLPRKCMLKYTPKMYQERYIDLLPEYMEELRNMPCIFAERNYRFGNTDEEHLVGIGKILDIIPQSKNIKIYFEQYETFAQEIINKNIERFGLVYNDLRNQLDTEHWSIRKGNLKEIIREQGIVVH